MTLTWVSLIPPLTECGPWALNYIQPSFLLILHHTPSPNQYVSTHTLPPWSLPWSSVLAFSTYFLGLRVSLLRLLILPHHLKPGVPAIPVGPGDGCMWALLTLPRFHMQTWLFLPPSAPRTGCRHSCGPSFAVICVYILYHKTKVGSCSRDQDQKTIDFPEREGKSFWINGKILFQMATINLPWNNHGCREESKSELIHLGKWKAAENIASASEKFKNKVISEQKYLKSDQETKTQLCIKEQLIDYRRKVSKYFSEANRRIFRSKIQQMLLHSHCQGPRLDP